MFIGGIPSWKKGNNTIYSSPAYITTSAAQEFPVVIVDVRNSSKVIKGHITGAVAYTPAELKKSKSKFPKAKSAPIIIYSDNEQEAVSAFNTIRKWGYKNASVLDGGLKAWQTAGNDLVNGSAGKKIVYVPKPIPGSIDIKQFKALASSTPSDTLILDVRDDAEAAGGMIKGALHVQTQDVAARLSEIPKHKKVIIHCKTGTRASMAYQTLKENGYNAQFLNAKIKIAKNGSFKIKPNS
ncbi:MAG: rhodanese-like domain-containing protein [SAR324 cluster bacterium]|nr:rhodanese-like domain-containing protein [SAR324 cluster bacterium]